MANDLIIANLAKRYGDVTALSGVSFTVAAGEIFGLLGKNGAGKTTTIECTIGLRIPDGGEIQICGVDALSHREEAKQWIGVQLQTSALQDKITPREALRLFASFYEKPADVEALLARFGLAEKAAAYYDTLSGGQRQRLALALAFVNQPRILFLDEPTAGLDAQSRRALHADIRGLRDEGHTVVLTTHYIEEAHALCDNIAIIDQGKIVAMGSPEQLISRAGGLSRIDVSTALPLSAEWLAAIPAVGDVQPHGGGWRLKTSQVAPTVTELVRRLQADNNELLDLHVHRPSLEDVFIELTGNGR
jgi:ABC-2 type transport system ATP-binding protein